MKIFLTGMGVLILTSLSFAQNKQPGFDQFAATFVSGYNALNLPGQDLSYVAGFQHIQSADSVQRQLVFFRSVMTQLPDYDPEKLTPPERLDYNLIKYETGLNLERIALEQAWIRYRPEGFRKKKGPHLI